MQSDADTQLLIDDWGNNSKKTDAVVYDNTGTDLNLLGSEGVPNQALNLSRKNDANVMQPLYVYFSFPLDEYEDFKLSFALDLAGSGHSEFYQVTSRVSSTLLDDDFVDARLDVDGNWDATDIDMSFSKDGQSLSGSDGFISLQPLHIGGSLPQGDYGLMTVELGDRFNIDSGYGYVRLEIRKPNAGTSNQSSNSGNFFDNFG